MKCIVLAGYDETSKPKRYDITGSEKYLECYKPLLVLEDLNHKSEVLIRSVAKAASASSLERVVVVGREEIERLLTDIPRVEFVKQGSDLGENIAIGLAALQPKAKEYVLCITSDLPRLTSETLDSLIEHYSGYTEVARDLPKQLISIVEEALIYPYPRRYFPAIDDLYRREPRITRLKEANYLLVTKEARTEMLSMFFSMRKMLQPHSWLILARLILSELPELSYLVGSGIVDLVKHRALSLSKLDAAFRIFLGEDKSPVTASLFTYSMWPEMSYDIDSDQDVSRLGFTIKSDFYEHKWLLRTTQSNINRLREFFHPLSRFNLFLSTFEAKEHGHLKTFAVQHYRDSSTMFLVSRWRSRKGFKDFTEKYKRDMQGFYFRLTRYVEQFKELGGFGYI